MSSSHHGIPPEEMHGKPGAISMGPASSLLTGLTAWYNLDEESGTRADSLETYDLTDVNTCGFAAGKIGNAVSTVDTRTEYLENATLTMGGAGTGCAFSVWFKTTQATIYPGPFCFDPGVDGKMALGLYFSTNALTGRCTDSDLTQKDVTIAATGANDGAWHNVIGWFDPADKKAYFSLDNAAAVSTAAQGQATLRTTGVTFKLGRWQYGRWTGEIDLTGVWAGRILTADERTSLYNSGDGITYPFTGT